MRYHLTILLGLLAAVMACSQAFAERRVALVVGNAHYANTAALRNPINDVDDVAVMLQKLGFDVVLATDVDETAFAKQIDNFARRLEGADVGLFYYAGHGLQVNDKNYLVSTNAKLESEFLVPSETIELNAVIHLMESRAAINLVFLDACRNNPLADNLRRSMQAERRAVALGRGLAKVEPTGRDTLVAFSAAPGQEASDGEGRNSPFASALLQHMPEPGLEVSVMLKLVNADVRQATQNSQRPQQLSDMTAAFYFAKAEPVPPKPAAAATAAPAPQPDQSVEVAFFQSAIAANDCQSIRSYLGRFPTGTFTDIAKLTEKRLCAVAAAEPAKPAAPAAPLPAPAAPVVAALPPANLPASAPPSAAEIARDLQTELLRVGCGGTGLKASGDWDAESRSALRLFNRYAKTSLATPSQDAIAAVHSRDGRVCPLICGRGTQAQGETCVAIPAQPSPPPPKQAARPRPNTRDTDDSPPPSRRQAARPRPNSPPSGPGSFAPEGGQQRGTRANNAISETPFTSGGQKCHTLDVMGSAPHIVCP